MIKRTGYILLFCAMLTWATETLHPVAPPRTQHSFSASLELDDDVYSSDLTLTTEVSPIRQFSLYADVAYRLLGYSYEYSTDGYVHNYCNLHVNGLNETYIGAKALLWKNFGLDFNWRLPPREGSQKNRFHRMNIEPYTFLRLSPTFTIGSAFHYNHFLEKQSFIPGDEIGVKASFIWDLSQDNINNEGWKFTEIFLYQARIEESKNTNLNKPYQGMKDEYRGFKMKFDLAYHFFVFCLPIDIGFNYEIHKGNIFGFETGHLIGFNIRITQK